MTSGVFPANMTVINRHMCRERIGMAGKKKTAPEKVRVELRIEPDLSERLVKLAEELGVSVNELMGGIMWWAVENARPGEIHLVNKSQEVLVDQPGSVWFEGTCQLDFRGRRVVVDRLEQLIEKRERREGRKP